MAHSVASKEIPHVIKCYSNNNGLYQNNPISEHLPVSVGEEYDLYNKNIQQTQVVVCSVGGFTLSGDIWGFFVALSVNCL